MTGPNSTLVLSPVGLALLEQFESLRLTAYQDQRGLWTIGWGHKGPEVVQGLIWTPQQASQAQQEDVCWAVKAVQDLVSVTLLQHQFDPLVTFTFNVGRTAFEDSTLLHLVNAGNFVAAGQQFPHWVYAGTAISSGLVRRRTAEMNMFLGVAA